MRTQYELDNNVYQKPALWTRLDYTFRSSKVNKYTTTLLLLLFSDFAVARQVLLRSFLLICEITPLLLIKLNYYTVTIILSLTLLLSSYHFGGFSSIFFPSFFLRLFPLNIFGRRHPPPLVNVVSTSEQRGVWWWCCKKNFIGILSSSWIIQSGWEEYWKRSDSRSKYVVLMKFCWIIKSVLVNLSWIILKLF